MPHLGALPPSSSSSLPPSSVASHTQPHLANHPRQHQRPRQEPLQPFTQELCRSVASALVREHLSGTNMAATLEKFREEDASQGEAISSRSTLVRYLRMEKLRKNNQSSDNPFSTLLEMLVAHLLAKSPLLTAAQRAVEADTGKETKQVPDARQSSKVNETRGLEIRTDERRGSQNERSRNSFARAGDDQQIAGSSLSHCNSDHLRVAGKTSKPTQNRPATAPSTTSKPSLKPKSFFDEDVIAITPECTVFPGAKASNVQPESSSGSAIDLAVIETDRNLAKQAAAEGVPTVLDKASVASLKNLLFGRTAPIQVFNDEWIGRQFRFSNRESLAYGLVQSKGGPCGLLAVVQAYILKNLMFDPDVSPLAQKDMFGSPLPSEELVKIALRKAITGILLACGETKQKYTVVWPDKPPLGFPAALGSRGSQQLDRIVTHSFTSKDSLEQFVDQHLDKFTANNQNGLVSLLLSAVLTRTIAGVIRDMDEPDTPLIGSYGYCTQEMVNLLVTGKAISNVFDGTVSLGADHGGPGAQCKILKGLEKQSLFGYLSLFEHYGNLKVGSRMRFPIYPIFVVCSESHYTVLFSPTSACLQATGDETDGNLPSGFDLFYYDGLANQEESIRLTVRPGQRHAFEKDDDLVSPLEHCIRTRWKGAEIDWNGIDPLL